MPAYRVPPEGKCNLCSLTLYNSFPGLNWEVVWYRSIRNAAENSFALNTRGLEMLLSKCLAIAPRLARLLPVAA